LFALLDLRLVNPLFICFRLEPTMSIATTLGNVYRQAANLLRASEPVYLLAIRLYLANVFFPSGLTKLTFGGGFPFVHVDEAAAAQFWELTLPITNEDGERMGVWELAPPDVPDEGNYENATALINTLFGFAGIAELLLPVLLVLGVAGRIGGLGLMIMSLVIALTAINLGQIAVIEGYMWAAMASVIVIYGPGKISVDHFLGKKFAPNQA